MKVCYITPYPLRMISGVSRVVTELCKGLKRNNIDHIVICGRLTDEVEKDDDIEALEIDVSKFTSFRGVYLAVKTIIEIFRNRKDIELLHMQTPHLQPMLSAIFGRILGLPVVTTIHGKFPRPKNSLRRLYFWATTKGTLLFSDRITFVDEEAKKYYKVPSGIVIKNGVDTELFSLDPNLREETRTKLGISKDEVTLLFLGRLVAHKGIFDLIDAFSATLNNTNMRLRLIVIGSGEIGEIEEKIRSLDLENHMLLLGKVKEVKNYYCASDIFVLYTSPLEGLPISLLEASSCSLAIISTSVSGIPTLIKDRNNGLLIEYGDKEGLIQNIKKMAEDEKLREYLGKNARERILDRYSMDKTVNKYVNLYKSLTRMRKAG